MYSYRKVDGVKEGTTTGNRAVLGWLLRTAGDFFMKWSTSKCHSMCLSLVLKSH